MAEVDITAVFQLLGNLSADMREMRKETSAMYKETKADIASLRQTLTEYHASVLGHGMMIGELEDRVRRIERHLNLPPHAAE